MSVYALESKIGNCCYIGSTRKPLRMRLQNHRASYNSFLTHGGCKSTSTQVVKFPDATIRMLEALPNASDVELRAAERRHIMNTSCVNKNIPTGICTANDKLYKTQYYIANKAKMLANTNNNYKRRKHEKILCQDCTKQVSKWNRKQHENTWTHKTKVLENIWTHTIKVLENI